MLDVSSHILFSPLQCKVPLPGFTGLQFCVSQYDEKERELLRNLCHILGGKLITKLTKKVNYLICKFREGPKYVAACEWGIQTVCIEWIWECVKQNKIVVTCGEFLPKEVTMSDREAGMCTTSQYPTQAVRMVSGSSELTQDPPKTTVDVQVDTRACMVRKEVKYSVMCRKRSRVSQDGSGSVISTENKVTGGEVSSKSVPDVAAAIEDLLEQTSKVTKRNCLGRYFEL